MNKHISAQISILYLYVKIKKYVTHTNRKRKISVRTKLDPWGMFIKIILFIVDVSKFSSKQKIDNYDFIN